MESVGVSQTSLPDRYKALLDVCGMVTCMDLDHFTRVDIVTRDGRKEHWADAWTLLSQDGGKTLVLYPHGDGAAAKQERLESFRKELKAIHESV